MDFSRRIKEKSLLFDKKLLEIDDNSYLDGYFQCEKYFKDIREIILKQFTINQDISNYTKEIKNKILEVATIFISDALDKKLTAIY